MLIPLLHKIIRRHLIRQGIQSKRVRIGGTNIHYYEASPERPVASILLVHGLGTSTSTWMHLLPGLAQKYHVLAPDLPGFGFSFRDDGFSPHTIDEYTGELDEFVSHTLPKDPFLLLGHSLGGWITMKYAIRRPQKVAHLILINSAGLHYQGVEHVRDLFDLRSPRDTKILLDHIWKHYPWYFRPFTPFVFEDLVRRKVPQIVQTIEERDFLNADLHRLTMPVSVIWGLGDRLISTKALELLKEKLPARRIYTIEQSGHVPQLEAPVELMEILWGILGEHTG
ncbi:MAG: alpha/beta fold hydrolase [Ignavibacteriales bacterium]|nr:alpha/beta fold hydrolase [Ignavibacteriales bacterium]